MRLRDEFGADVEEHLGFFARVVAGKNVVVEIGEGDWAVSCSSANPARKKIAIGEASFQTLTGDELRKAVIATVLHEAAHVRFSGSITAHIMCPSKLLLQIVNVVEDVRIETLLSNIYPQSEQYLIDEFLRVAASLRSKGLHMTDPLVALRFVLENKCDTRANFEPELLSGLNEFLRFAEREAQDRDIWSATWREVIEYSEKLEAYLTQHELSSFCNQEPNESFMSAGDDAGKTRVQLAESELFEGDVGKTAKNSPAFTTEEEAQEALKGALEQKSDVEVLTRTMAEAASRFDANSAPNGEEAVRQGRQMAADLKRQLQISSTQIKRRKYGALDISEVKRKMRAGKEMENVFMRRSGQLGRYAHNVCVLIDMSGSMTKEKRQWAHQAILTLLSAFEDMPKAKCTIRGFSATNAKKRINDIVIKEFEDQYIDEQLLSYLGVPRGDGFEGQNRDGDSIRHATELLQERTGKKLLVVVSDGAPHHGGTGYVEQFAIRDTKTAVVEAEVAGVAVFGISIDKDADGVVKKIYGENAVRCSEETMHHLGEKIVELYTEKLGGVR